MNNHFEIARGEEFTHDFGDWLAENMSIYREFERQARLIASRRDRYSARTIAEVIRHNSLLAEQGGPWKINNNRIPDMARLFSALHPEHDGFFQLRDSCFRLGLSMPMKEAA
jgi:hypothetical protein